MLTNGEVCGPGPGAGELRKFRVQAEFGNWLWVEAMNGNYKGEMLTFDGRVLAPYKDRKCST
jgi:hypothetical protein